MASFTPSTSDIPNETTSFSPSLSDINEIENQNNPSFLEKIKSFLPKPQLPIGMGIASGLATSFMPEQQKQVFNQLPNALLQQPQDFTQKAGNFIGGGIPSLAIGGDKLLSQGLIGGLQGAATAEPNQRISSGIENALSSMGLGVGAKLFDHILNYANPKEIYKNVQNAHDLLKEKASNAFNDVSSEVNNREINQIPINNNLFDDVFKRKYMSLTPQSKELVDKAKNGDYDSLRDLQSELWNKATKASGSKSIPNQNRAEEMFNLRDQINDSILNHLNNSGNIDLANKLTGAIKDYKTLQDTFFNKDLPKSIKNLVGPNQRISKNVMDALQDQSNAGNNLREFLMKGSFSPEQNAITNIPKAEKTQESQANAMKWLKRSAIGGLVGTGTIGGGAYILDKVLNALDMQPLSNEKE